MPGPGSAGGGGFSGGSYLDVPSNTPFLGMSDSFVSTILDTFESFYDVFTTPLGTLLDSYNNIFADLTNIVLDSLGLANATLIGLMFGSFLIVSVIVAVIRFFALR